MIQLRSMSALTRVSNFPNAPNFPRDETQIKEEIKVEDEEEIFELTDVEPVRQVVESNVLEHQFGLRLRRKTARLSNSCVFVNTEVMPKTEVPDILESSGSESADSPPPLLAAEEAAPSWNTRTHCDRATSPRPPTCDRATSPIWEFQAEDAAQPPKPQAAVQVCLNVGYVMPMKRAAPVAEPLNRVAHNRRLARGSPDLQENGPQVNGKHMRAAADGRRTSRRTRSERGPLDRALPSRGKEGPLPPSEGGAARPGSEGPFRCEKCFRDFSRLDKLRVHLRTHAGVKPFVCCICGAAYADSSNLKSHGNVHTGLKPFKCEICGWSFKFSNNLTIHKRKHTGERPYKCSYCGRDFSQSSSLKTHVLLHTGEHPYKCDTCHKSFITSSNLTKHIRTHTGEKPYHCEDCGKYFSLSTTLKNHMKIHTGERDYLCVICNKQFLRSDHLKGHMRNAHREAASETRRRGTIGMIYDRPLEEDDRKRIAEKDSKDRING